MYPLELPRFLPVSDHGRVARSHPEVWNFLDVRSAYPRKCVNQEFQLILGAIRCTIARVKGIRLRNHTCEKAPGYDGL